VRKLRQPPARDVVVSSNEVPWRRPCCTWSLVGNADLGRHHIGSNFFWYLRDPAGTSPSTTPDLDEIVDEQLWKPEAMQAARGLYNWARHRRRRSSGRRPRRTDDRCALPAAITVTELLVLNCVYGSSRPSHWTVHASAPW